MTKVKQRFKINKSLQKPELIELAHVVANPHNENEHSDEQIQTLSIEMNLFGQQKPIVGTLVENSGEFLLQAGEGTYRAALVLGWTHLVGVIFDGSVSDAEMYRVADNKIAAMAVLNEAKVLATHARVLDAYEGLGIEPDFSPVTGMGYTETEMDEIGAKLREAADEQTEDAPPGDDEGPEERAPQSPIIAYQIVFDTEDQQQKWWGFLRRLKEAKPDAESIAARIIDYLDAPDKLPASKSVPIAGPVGRNFYGINFDESTDFAKFLDLVRRLQDTYKGEAIKGDGARIVKFMQEALEE